MDLFGFEFKRKTKLDDLPSVAPKESDDGAVVIAAGGGYGTYIDLDGTIRTEAELVTKYREMALQPECDAAVDEIVNESMSIDEEIIVDVNLDECPISDPIKKKIREEFKIALKLLDFNNHAYDIYRRWYIDGRLYYHCVIDDKDPKAGIKEIRYIDPRKIRKIREVARKRLPVSSPGDAVISKTVNEYFMFNDKGFSYGNKIVGPATVGLRLAKDSILHIVSGLTDNMGSMVLSYLHKGIKALNQLRTLEDALVIYRLARAPERRIWYIDVGNLPKMKAEQYVRDIMVRHKNRLIYDSSTGEVRDDRKMMTMLEDYWLPRREGGRGTEVTTLPGGQTLGQMDDVLYFQKKFLQCLNVPVSRLNSDALFSVGRATEITRDELKFSRFVIRLRAKFAMIFLKILEKQMVLKGLMTIEEWQEIEGTITFEFSKDNYFTELKDAEILNGRLELADKIQPYAEKYYSHKWIRKNILKQSDDDLEEMDSEIEEEGESGELRWVNPELMQMQADMDMLNAEEDNGDGEEKEETFENPGEPDENAPDRKKIEAIRQAQIYVKSMKKKPKEERSDEQQSKYKAAVQIIARNPALLKRMGKAPSKSGSETKGQ